MKIFTFILILICSLQSVAEEKLTVFYQAEIYQLNNDLVKDTPLDELLQNSTLLHTPKLMGYAGEAAVIEIGEEQVQIIRVDLMSDKEATQFNVNFSAMSKENDGWRTISFETPSVDIGNTVVAKTHIDDEQLLVKVHAQLVKSQ